MAKVYYEKDANLEVLKGRRIAIIGYGSQGHAQAQNLRDSGLDIIVSEVEGTDNYQLAVEHGFKPVSCAQASKEADIIQILIPDTIQGEVYKKDIEPNLEEGDALAFSHGFNIRFKEILPPKNIDVFMVAPKGPGHLVRRMFTLGEGTPALVAIEQDYTGRAKEIALAYAKGIGCTRAGVLETTFAEETETDLFGEQVILCGGVSELIKAAFATLVEAGYQPEVAYFECLHELKLITDLIYEGGLTWMRYSVSDTAEYGDLTRGKRVISQTVRDEMKKILSEVKDGSFAREWMAECKAGYPKFNELREKEKGLLIEKVGKELRAMMPFIKRK